VLWRIAGRQFTKDAPEDLRVAHSWPWSSVIRIMERLESLMENL
jgi:hypothetical protein